VGSLAVPALVAASGDQARGTRQPRRHGAQLKDVQKAAGHRDPGTTKLYDRRGYNPGKAASFSRPADYLV
jgi:hypothetical protein